MKIKMTTGSDAGRKGTAEADAHEPGRYIVRLAGGSTRYGVERSEFTAKSATDEEVPCDCGNGGVDGPGHRHARRNP